MKALEISARIEFHENEEFNSIERLELDIEEVLREFFNEQLERKVKLVDVDQA